MKNIKDGLKEFGCTRHGIDYRKLCDECDVMYDKFHDYLMEIREVQDEMDKNVPTLNDTITGDDK